MLPVGLTTVDTPIFQLGSQAATMLVNLVEELETERRIELGTELIIRQSA